jgi:chlorobactene glucosyltransferase
MALVVYALVGLMVLAAAGWGALLVYNVVKLRGVPRLRAADASRFPSDAPLVSVLVPARNEASRILEEAVRSIAAQDYPNVEVVVVDDRSTDRTYELLHNLSRAEPRLRAVRGEPLPPGWTGKVWALEQAKRHARGTWLLATDADVVFEPAAVRAAMSAAFRGRLDAITLLPQIGADTFWARTIMPVAAWGITMTIPIDKTNDPASPVALGCGGFFLMRRQAHDAAGGYEAIRGAVLDDVGTARALKSTGARLRIENGEELLYTPMYGSLAEVWHGFSKNAFAGANNSLVRAVANSIASLAATVLPMVLSVGGLALWLGFGVTAALPVALAAAVAWIAMTASFVPVYWALGRRPHYALLAGVANLILILILVNSAYRTLSGRGVFWRGQHVALR